MTGQQQAKRAAPAASSRPAETLDQRVERMRLEVEALELELKLNTLRARAAQLPERKEL